MNANVVVMILKSLYRTGVRALLIDAVRRTETPYDDHLIVLLDALLDVRETNVNKD